MPVPSAFDCDGGMLKVWNQPSHGEKVCTKHAKFKVTESVFVPLITECRVHVSDRFGRAASRGRTATEARGARGSVRCVIHRADFAAKREKYVINFKYGRIAKTLDRATWRKPSPEVDDNVRTALSPCPVMKRGKQAVGL